MSWMEAEIEQSSLLSDLSECGCYCCPITWIDMTTWLDPLAECFVFDEIE